MKQSRSTVPPPSRPLFRAQSTRRKPMRTWPMMLVLAPPLQKKRVIALAIVPFLMHVPREMKCWTQKMMQGSVLPPQDVDPPSSSPTSQSSESPIKRRPGSKASAGRAQSKKLRKSPAPPSRQPLGSIPEHEQPPATLADLASQNTQIRQLLLAGIPRHHLAALDRCKSAHMR